MRSPQIATSIAAVARAGQKPWVRRSVMVACVTALGASSISVAALSNRGGVASALQAVAPPTLTVSPVDYEPPVIVPAGVRKALSSASGELAASRTRKLDTIDRAQAVDIPPVAYLAYQRAAQVLSAAAPSCRLEWSLLAAIGRVESNHGSHGGSALDASGRARPEIYGPQLRKIADTDAGELDGDQKFDRAVGPMQFIPTTWAAVGVDSDGDGVRDPQNINDAALAAGVYLCAADRDLSRSKDRKAAVWSYNHSDAYVRLVLDIARSYAVGTVPDTLTMRQIGDFPTLLPSWPTQPGQVSTPPTPTETPTGPTTSPSTRTPTPTVSATPTPTVSASPTTSSPTASATASAQPIPISPSPLVCETPAVDPSAPAETVATQGADLLDNPCLTPPESPVVSPSTVILPTSPPQPTG